MGGTWLTCDPEAACVQGGTLRRGHVHLQAQLLQGPAVGLGHVLPCGRNVGLGHEQAPKAHVDVLRGGLRGKPAGAPATLQPSGGLSPSQPKVRLLPTFSSLAPPAAAACEMLWSCLILSLKSDTHWMTVMPAGTV